MRVELRAAPLPFIGAIAEHCWFVVFDDAGRCRRWEVWQTANAGGTSVGHVHCDLKGPDDGVGGGPMRLIAKWEGESALEINAVLRALEREKNYPHAHRYVPWPGPNSNTFVAWVLRRAGVRFRLPWKALGRWYVGRGR